MKTEIYKNESLDLKDIFFCVILQMQTYIQIISFQGIFIIIKQFQMNISNQRGQQRMKKEEELYQTQSQGYGFDTSSNREVDQFQSQSELMSEWHHMKEQERGLQKDCKDIEEDILKTEKDLVNLRQKYDPQQQKDFQLKLQKRRTKNLINLIKSQNYRLEEKIKKIGYEERKEIQNEIQMAYEMQINSIKRKFKQAKDGEISKVFDEYFPLYKSLQSSEGTVDRQFQYQLKKFNTPQKKSKILAWINVEKQKRSLLNLLKEKKVQQFQLQLELKHAKNEDKEEIEVKIFRVSLDIKDLENQLKEPQNKNIVKSDIQIKYQNLEKQILQMEQFYQEKKQKAVDQRQKSFIRLAECISFGNKAIQTNGQNIELTSFLKHYSQISYYQNRLIQIQEQLENRRQSSLQIKIQEKQLKKCKQDYKKKQNELKQIEAIIKQYTLSAMPRYKLQRVNSAK